MTEKRCSTERPSRHRPRLTEILKSSEGRAMTTNLLSLVACVRHSSGPLNMVANWNELLAGVTEAGMMAVQDAIDHAPDDVARSLLTDALAEVLALERTAVELES